MRHEIGLQENESRHCVHVHFYLTLIYLIKLLKDTVYNKSRQHEHDYYMSCVCLDWYC